MVFNKSLYVLLIIGGLSSFADKPAELPRIFGNISSAFTDYYAPREWKKQRYGWNIEAELASLSGIIQNGGKISDFHDSLKQFFVKTRDYHTSVFFADSSSSRLPLGIKYINGDFYLAYIDKSVLPTFSLMLGDKIISFNDVDVKTLAWSLIGNIENPSPTDWALAARKLTTRVGAVRDKVEKGSVVIKAERNNKNYFGQLVWNYNKNLMNNTGLNKSAINLSKDINPDIRKDLEQIINHIEDRSHKVSFADYMKEAAQDKANNPLAFASRDSFLPKLGSKIVWSSAPESRWQAYIYQNENNNLVGFIRLPTFAPEENDYSERAKEFGEIINKMEELTDALIIDQQNNPGGSIFYLYALASMLTDQPLKNPRHRFSIDSKEVWQAHDMLKNIDTLLMLLPMLGGSIGDLHGYPLDTQFFLHMKSYFQFIVEQWEENKMLTDPYFLYGVDYIQPNSQYRYTKTLVLLTNELDFSGGDFFPAILKDSGRATIIGKNTAGAGGYVLSNEERNRVGIIKYSYTGSHAIRANGEPLEDLGVAPDVPYEISPTDLMTKFEPYKIVINTVVKALLTLR